MRNSEFGMRNEPDLKKRTKAFALRILKLVDLHCRRQRRVARSHHRSCVPAHLWRLTIALPAARDRPQTSLPRWASSKRKRDETLFWLELLEESELVSATEAHRDQARSQRTDRDHNRLN